MNLEKIERLCLQATLAIPLFAVFVCLAVQAGSLTMPMRELTLLCMGATAGWCICIPRLASFEHMAFFGFGIFWSALVFGLDRQAFTDFAPLMLIGPQAILFGVAVRLAAEEAGHDPA